MATRADRTAGKRPGAARLALAAGLVAALLLLAVAMVLLARRPLAGLAAETALARAGIEASVTVTRLGPNGAAAVIESRDADVGTLSGRIAARYGLGTLLRQRRLDTLIVRDLRGTLVWSPEGGVRLEGLPALGGGGGGTAQPVRIGSLVIEDAALAIVTPAGEGDATGSARWSDGEGQAALRITGDRLGTAERYVGALDAAARLTGSGGAVSLRAEGRGDVSADGVTARGLTVRAVGRGRLGETPSGTGRIAFATDALSRGDAAAAVSGTIDVGWDGETLAAEVNEPVVLRLGETTATLAAGAELVVGDQVTEDQVTGRQVTGHQAAGDQRVRGGGTVSLTGPLATGELTLTAEREDGTVRFAAEGALSALAARGVAASGVTLALRGAVGNDRVAGQGTARAATLRHEASGLTASDVRTPVRFERTAEDAGGAVIHVHLSAKSEQTGEAACLRAAALTGPAGALRLTDAAACDAHVAVSEGGAAARGALRAGRATATLGERTVTAGGLSGPVTLSGPADGAPQVAFDPVVRQLTTEGWQATDLAASVRATLGDAARVKATDLAATLAQTADAPTLAPVRLSGEAAFAGDEASARLGLGTPRGQALGALSLTHDLGANRGRLAFESEALTFAPGGLQPARLIPALRGVVTGASGRARGSAEAHWDAAGLRTGGTLVLDDLSFAGPTVAIARTEGLTTTLNLSSLRPLRTDGVQTGTLDALDFGAVRLADGAFAVALPGDDSVVVEAASFPWMGGRLALDETAISFGGGGGAAVRLEGLSLDALLSAVDVPGLSGEGTLSGTLPLAFDAFSVAIEGGRVESEGPGAIRYTGAAAEGASDAAEGARIAFSALENLRFDRLSGTVDGPLSGTLDFGLRFEGRGDIDFGERASERVTAPVIYNIDVEAPLLGLLDQARLTTDTRRQIREGRRQMGEPLDPDRLIEENPEIFR